MSGSSIAVGFASVGLLMVFGYQNQEPMQVRFLWWTISTSRALMLGSLYVAGLVTGLVMNSKRRR